MKVEKQDFGKNCRMGELQDKASLGAEKMRGKFEEKRENSGQIHIMKSHFAGRDFGNGEDSGTERIRGKRKNAGQIHIGKSHFEDEERLRGRGETLGKKNSGKKTWDKYILGSLTSQTKRDFGDGEDSGTGRIRRKRENAGQIHIGKSHFEDEERLRIKQS
jgi:hypothetical protein